MGRKRKARPLKTAPEPAERPRPNPGPCPLCHGAARFFCSGDRREYWRCPRCGLIFVPPDFFLDREEEVERYLQHENSLDNSGYVKMFLEKIHIVRAVCANVHTVLDFGCGYEPVLQTLLSREGYAADGYDLNFFADRELRSSYDLIISAETFEHFKEPGKEIDAIVSMLPEKGYLAVMTRFYPDAESPAPQEQFGNWYYKRDPTHIAFYSSRAFAWIAKDNGLEIIYNNEKDFIILQGKNGRLSGVSD